MGEPLSPAVLELIQQLAEIMVAEDYLAAQASNDAGSGCGRPNHPPLPATDEAA